MKNQIIITLGREHGSGGHYIADMIAQELGIKLYDKDSIEKEIVSEGYSGEMIRKMDEKPVNFFASRRIGKYSNSLEVNVAEKTFAMRAALRHGISSTYMRFPAFSLLPTRFITRRAASSALYSPLPRPPGRYFPREMASLKSTVPRSSQRAGGISCPSSAAKLSSDTCCTSARR